MQNTKIKVIVEAECSNCEGSGLVADGEGYAWICTDCKGSGHVTVEYIPFTGRRILPAVHTVLVQEAYGRPLEFKVQEFLDGEIPPLNQI